MELRKYLVEKLEEYLRYVYKFVDENDIVLGNILQGLHLFSMCFILILILMCHLVYPTFWFQFVVFIILLALCIQHIILHGCICSALEIKLLGKSAPISIDFLLNLLKIPISNNSRMGITILLSSSITLFMGIELIARSNLYLRELSGISTWA